MAGRSAINVVIIGNGILGLAVASGLLKRDPRLSVTIVGPQSRPFCASAAAAAMLNSFAELEPGALDQERDRAKFDVSRAAARMWPAFVAENGIPGGFLRLGTAVINNTATDDLDDQNFKAILDGLKEFSEPHERIQPAAIKGYRPGPHARATQAVFIPGEGWVNPDGALNALQQDLVRRGVLLQDQSVQKLVPSPNGVGHVVLSDGRKVEGDLFIVANGAYASSLCLESGIAPGLLPILHGVGYTLALESKSIHNDCVIRTPNRGLACGIYHVPYNPGSVVVGASNYVTTAPDRNPRIVSLHYLMGGAIDQINTDHARSTLLKINVGNRPTSIDAYPVIGWLNGNTYIVSGTKRDGYHMAPYYAEQCSAELLSGKTSEKYLKFCDPYRKPYAFGTAEDCARRYARHKMSALGQHGYRAGHSSSTNDLLAHYQGVVGACLEKHGIHAGIATELIEPLLGGYLDPAPFKR